MEDRKKRSLISAEDTVNLFISGAINSLCFSLVYNFLRMNFQASLTYIKIEIGTYFPKDLFY